MIASLMMGLAFGTGGMVIPLVRKLADIFSVRLVLFFLERAADLRWLKRTNELAFLLSLVPAFVI